MEAEQVQRPLKPLRSRAIALSDDFFDEIVKRQKVEAKASEENVRKALRFLADGRMKRDELCI
jgi:hypothetical protein